MIGLPQDCDHLSLNEFPADDAERAVKSLEVQRTEVVAIPHEKAALSQVTAAHCTQTCVHTGKRKD